MISDLRSILDFVLADRLRDICERRGLATSGTRQDQRERVVKSLGGKVDGLLPLLVRAELVEFLATRDVGGRFAFVSRASRPELERLLTMLCSGDPRVTDEQPLGGDSPIRFERKVVWPKPPPPVTSPRVSEKIFRSRVHRRRGFLYYVKDGDVWEAPARRAGAKRSAQRVHEAGLPMDHVTYLYYVDADGDIARKRRDGAPVSTSASADGEDEPVQVFISYARNDRRFLQELCDALAGHEGQREIALYFDQRTDTGAVWEPVLMSELQRADVVVLLLSNDFMSSRYCNENEWPVIQARHRRGECELAPVLIRPCFFQKSTVGAYQLIRPNDRAVDDHPRHDVAWLEVVNALDKVFETARAKRR